MISWYNTHKNKSFIVKPKPRVILEQAIDEGIRFGYRRAHKHTEEPDESYLIETISNEIMNQIDLYFDFEEETNV